MSETIDMKALGLKPREQQVMRAARWALTQVSNGHYLASPGQRRAGERMVERGFLTKIDAQFSPPMPDWLVVKLTQENWNAMLAAMSAGDRQT